MGRGETMPAVGGSDNPVSGAELAGHEGDFAKSLSKMSTPSRFPFLCALLGTLGGAWALPAAEVRLPPLVGELSGDFRPFESAAAPKLHWVSTIGATLPGNEGRLIETKIDGDGTRLRLAVSLTTREQGVWEMADSEIDLATWFPLITERVGSALEGLAAVGVIKVTGKGLMRDGKPSGVLQVTLRDGRLENALSGWKLENVALTSELLVEAEGIKIQSTTPFELTVGTIGTTRFGARNLVVRGVLKEDHTIEMAEAQIEIAGGRAKIDPAVLQLSPVAIEASLHIMDVGLQDIAALVPQSFAAARGRIDGVVRLAWNKADGFRVGAGDLSLGASEPAIVQLAPTPGFLTRTMPKRFEPVPTWLGPLSRWLSADNPVYTNLEQIENGISPLQVDTLSVRLTPEGDVRGRTAVVQMTAHPTDPQAAVKRVNFDVNVAGPIDSILKLGLNRDAAIEIHQ